MLVESPAIAETLVKAGAVQTPMEREAILFLDRKMTNVWNKKLASRDDAALFSGCASVPCRRRWLPVHMVVFNLACIAADRRSREDEGKEDVEEEEKFRKLLLILRPEVKACVLPAVHLNSYMTDCLWDWTEDMDELEHYAKFEALFNSTGEQVSKFRALQGSSASSDGGAAPLSPWEVAGSHLEHAVADFEKQPAAAKALEMLLVVLGQVGPEFVDEEEGLGLVAGAGQGIVMLVANAVKPLAEAAFSAAFGSAEGAKTESREASSEKALPELAAAAQEMHRQGTLDESLLDGMLRDAHKKIDSGVAGTPQDWIEVLAFCAGRQVPSGAGSEQRVAVRHFMNSLVYLFAEVIEGSLRPYSYSDRGIPGFSPVGDFPEDIQFHQWLGRKEAKGSQGSDEDDGDDYPEKQGIWPDMVLAGISKDEGLLALLLPKVADEFKKNQEDDEDKKKKIFGTAVRKLRLLKDPNLKEYLCDFLFGRFESEDNSLLEDVTVNEHGGFFELLALSCASLDKQQRKKKLEVLVAELPELDEDDGPILLQHLEPMLSGLFDYVTSLLMEHGDKAKAEASKGSEHLGNLVLWGDLCQNQALLTKSASQFSLHLEDALKAYEEAIEIASYSSSEAGKQAKFGAMEVLTLLNRESEALTVAATLL